MTRTENRVGATAKMRWFLAALAIVAMPLWGCSDAGDSPAAPGDGGPNGDTGESRISASVDNGYPGSLVAISGQYQDATGDTVEGVKILASAEGWGRYFSFVTNPTYTDSNGKFSIDMNISSITPPGSYTLVLRTSPGWDAPMTVDYIHFKVLGESAGPLLDITASATEYYLSSGKGVSFAISAEGDCKLDINYQYSGPGITSVNQTITWSSTTGNPGARFTLTPTATGVLTVYARAWCEESPSDDVTKTVTVPVY